ncbi:MAG: phage tail tape measure protein [Candidatus Adiutrix sp.]|jgi:hypothetical protein|nr:phage tail tape measure protein [Candidatus Adiutrix sp.]
MATIVDALLITLGLDADGVKAGIKDADGAVSNGVKKMESKLSTAMKGAARFLAPVLGGVAIKAALDDYVATADRLGDVSESLNMSGHELDTWGKAAIVAGGSAEGLEGSIRGLGTQIENAVTFGMKKSQKVFDELGISLKDAEGNTKSATQVMTDLAAVADTMDKAQFAGIAKKLGFDDGSIMLMQRGKAGLAQLLGEMEGYALTDKEIAAAGEYDEKMNRLSFSVKAVSNMFLSLLVPALDFVAKTLTKIFTFLREHKAFTYAFFTGLAAVIMSVCIPALGAMAAAAWAAISPFLPAIAIIAGLALIFDDFWTYVNGGESALEDFWSLFGTGEEISAKLAAAWEVLKASGEALWNGLKAAFRLYFEYFGPAMETMLSAMDSAMVALGALLSGDFGTFKDKFIEAFAKIGDAILLQIGGAFQAVWDLAVTIFDKIADLAGEKIKTAVGFLTGGEGMAAMHGNNFNYSAGNAVSPSKAASAGNIDQSKHDIRIETNVTNSTPEAVAGWNKANIDRANQEALVRNFNSGANQGGSR